MEEQKELTPEEKALLSDTQHSPADMAAAHFQLKYPHFKRGLKDLSRNELERVTLNLIAGPLTPKENQLKNEHEKKIWYLGEELLQALTIMKIELEMQRMEAAKVSEDAKQELVNEAQRLKLGYEGESNG